jgi:two-component system, LuxR family, sensor kinase FixL
MFQFLFRLGGSTRQNSSELGSLKPFGIPVSAFVFATIALIWFAVFEKTRFEQQDAIDAAVRENVNRAVALEQYTTRLIETADRALLHVKEHFESDGGNLRHADQLTDSMSRHPVFKAISIFDENGRQAASSLPATLRQEFWNHAAFAAHRSSGSGTPHISQPLHSEALGDDYVWLTRRLNHRDGSFAGVVGVQIAPSTFTEFYRDATLGPLDVISVIGLDGVTRARRTGNLESYGENLTGKLVMRMQQQNPNGTYLGPSVLDGIDRYFSHRRLKDYPMFVTSGVARSEILKTVNSHSRWYYAGAGIVSLSALAFAIVLLIGIRHRRRQVLEIAAAAERLQRAQSLAKIGDWEFDFESRLIRWSPQLCEHIGRDPSKTILTVDEYTAYICEADREAVWNKVAQAVDTGQPQEFEFRVHTSTGGARWHLALAVPTIDSAGKVIGLHGIDQDINDRKLLEKLQSEVEHLSRLDAMNTMAATLAHELNQPLAAASNYLTGSRRILDKEDGDKELAKTGIVHATQQVMLAGDIIRRARDMITNRPKQASGFSIATAVADAVALIMAAKDDHGASIKQRIRGQGVLASGDRIQIQQVLVNLVRNACEATMSRNAPEVTIMSRRTKGELIVSVIDNGPGIADAETLFSPFKTSKPQGLGLGLSISRTIVEAHGGRIWVAKSGSSGTTISFCLPIEPAHEKTAEAA